MNAGQDFANIIPPRVLLVADPSLVPFHTQNFFACIGDSAWVCDLLDQLGNDKANNTTSHQESRKLPLTLLFASLSFCMSFRKMCVRALEHDLSGLKTFVNRSPLFILLVSCHVKIHSPAAQFS